jgi:15-cis-phytoene synthase
MQPHCWPDPGHASPADLAACREALRAGSRTFHAASLLLPAEVRESACSLYAFCRLADDAVDLRGGCADALPRLRERLARACEGRPLDSPVDRAFADVVARHAVPRELPEALFEGFAWDVAGRRYEDLAEVRAYAARVAGTVGAMMAVLMGARDPDVVARACDLGVAMQLSNIARDVGEDARAGRLYLPLRWLREAGIDPEAWLARPAFDPALGSVVARLLAEADALYARSAAGIARLPAGCRAGIHAARLLYAGIGREVGRQGLDSVSRRAVVPLPRKLGLLARAVAAAALPARPWLGEPPLDEVRFLVEAVAAQGLWAGSAARPAPWWDLGGRAVWVVRLFERLEERRGEGAARQGSAP